MFAVSIERNNRIVGDELAILANRAEGLAGNPFDQTAIWQRDGVTLIQQTRWNTASQKFHSEICCHKESGVRIVGWMRLDNVYELKSKLGIYRSGAEQLSDHNYVIEAYLKWNEDCCDHLVGDFCFVIFDPSNNTCIAARDHMGTRPLYYYLDDERLIFTTSMAILNKLDTLSLSPSKRWMAQQLAIFTADLNETAYQQVKKIPPATIAKYTFSNVASGQAHLQKRRYFEFDPDSQILLKTDQEYVEAYKEILNEAVRCRTVSEYDIAAESSGGLDSSSLVAISAEKLQSQQKNLHCYGFAHTPLEAQKILAVSALSAIHSTHLFNFNTWCGAGDCTQFNERFIRQAGVPYKQVDSALHHPLCESMQLNGARTILSGFGGDEFSTNQANIAKTELLDNAEYKLWSSRLPGSAGQRSVRALKHAALQGFKKLQSFITQEYPRTANENRVKNGIENRWNYRILSDAICDEYELKQSLLEPVNQYFHCRTVNSRILNSQWQALSVVRLEDSQLTASGYGLEYRWPLLDIRLIKFYLSVPPEQKLGPGGETRYLHRRAMQNRLPEGIGGKVSAGPRFQRSSTAPQHIDFSMCEPGTAFDDLHDNLKEIIDESRLHNVKHLYQFGGQPREARMWLNQLYVLNSWLHNNF